MLKAYIILAHTRPTQLGRLVRSLDDGSSHFFIHIDRNCDARPFQQELPNRDYCQQIVPRERGDWGQCGIVKATLSGLRAILETHLDFGIIQLISGQDYPLRSNAYINRFFELNRDRIFIEHWSLPAAFWPHGGLDRIHTYHIGGRRRRSRQRLSKLVTWACNRSVILRRRFPSGLTPYGGWQWWSITLQAAEEILQFTRRRPDYLRYHHWSLLPDEMFFQTILLNSRSERIQTNIVNNCLRFVDWDNPNPATPATLTENYLPILRNSKSLFARKFDTRIDSSVLDRIDECREIEKQALLLADSTTTINFDRSLDFPNSPASPGTKHGDNYRQMYQFPNGT